MQTRNCSSFFRSPCFWTQASHVTDYAERFYYLCSKKAMENGTCSPTAAYLTTLKTFALGYLRRKLTEFDSRQRCCTMAATLPYTWRIGYSCDDRTASIPPLAIKLFPTTAQWKEPKLEPCRKAYPGLHNSCASSRAVQCCASLTLFSCHSEC